MGVSATLGWESDIAAGASKDAAALRRLTKALTQANAAASATSTAALTSSLGQLGNASALASVQVEQLRLAQQREGAASAAAAQQNAAAAKMIVASHAASIKASQDETKATAKDAAERVKIADKAAKDIAKAQEKAAKDSAREQEKIARDSAQAQSRESARRVGAAGNAATGVLSAAGLTSQAGGITSNLVEALGGSAALAGPIGVAVGATIAAAKKVFGVVYEAYEKAISVIEALGTQGVSMVLSATASKESIVAAFEAMHKSSSESERLYEQIAAQSIKTNRSKETIAAEFKRLSVAGFKDNQLAPIAKMLADDAVAQGEGKANQLEKMFVTINSKGSLDPRVVSALNKQGFGQEKLYAELAKSMPGHHLAKDIPALIKAGKVDAKTAEDAIAKVVENKIGGVAAGQANTVLALLSRIQMAISELFVVSEKAQAPVKEFLNTILDNLSPESAKGRALKNALDGLFGALSGTAFDDLNSKAGKLTIGGVFDSVTDGVKQATAAVRSLRPEVLQLIALFKQMSHDGTIKSLVGAGKLAAGEKLASAGDTARATKTAAEIATGKSADVAGTSDTVQDIRRHLGTTDSKYNKRGFGEQAADLVTGGGYSGIRSLFDDDDAPQKKGPGAVNGYALNNAAANQNATALGTGSADSLQATDLYGAGNQNGNDLAQGTADGVTAGTPNAVSAAVAMANAMKIASKQALDSHSPSRVFHAIGMSVPQGAAGGVDAAAHHAINAVGRMSDGMTDAADFGGMSFGASGGASGGAGKSGGGGGHTFVINVAGGASARAGGDEALADLITQKIDEHFRKMAA